MRRFGSLLAGVAVSIVLGGAPPAVALEPARIDDTVARAMARFQIPGVAVGVVKDGRVVFAKGYGVRRAGAPEPVDTTTVFQIGSNTKAFTAAALALLVDEGRLGWDDKVVDHIPQFQLSDPYATRELTVRDLLTHRSGLGPGAGDLMYYPATDFTRAELIRGLRYLKPTSSFRSEFGYDNLLYMVAGELVPAVAGQSWEDFVTARIFAPLEMRNCSSNGARAAGRGALAAPHVPAAGGVQPIPREPLDVIGPAGTIHCDLDGMLRWVNTQLAGGTAPNGVRLFSAARGAEMWTPIMPQPLNPAVASLTGTHFKAYGLGWDTFDEFGFKRVSHTGFVPGMVTWVAMIPELRVGVVVLTNQEDSLGMEAIGNQILDSYVGAPKRDLVTVLGALADARRGGEDKAEAELADRLARAGAPPLPLSAYAGEYADPWRGEAEVRREGPRLVLRFSRTAALEGTLHPYSGNVFVVRWNERRLQADAFVNFSQGFDGSVDGMTLRAVSAATDFSFDFQDLAFKRVTPGRPAP